MFQIMLASSLYRMSCGNLLRVPTTTLSPLQTMATMKPISQSEHLTGQEYWAKNKALNRPISPHLTIYKFQLTSMLSITHRGTGLAQSGMLSGVGLGALMLPGNYPMFLSQVVDMQFGGAVIFTTKFILAWPVMFHLWNGFRHLAWDMGHGFKIPELYKTGWFVVGLSVVTALALAVM